MSKKYYLSAGQKFNSLTVVSFHHNSKKTDYYLCKCDCGNDKVVSKSHLVFGDIKSCGCLQRKAASNLLKTHGLSKTRLHRIWIAMRTRCNNKNFLYYKNYGGRGVKVCKEWNKSFITFYNWAMANGYRDGLTIDRINNEGNYEPKNCRFITKKEQDRNKRTNCIIVYKGEKHCIKEWSEILNISYNKLRTRIARGWPIGKSFEYK